MAIPQQTLDRLRDLNAAIARTAALQNPSQQDLSNIAQWQAEALNIQDQSDREQQTEFAGMLDKTIPQTTGIDPAEQKAIEDIFNTRKTSQTNALNEVFNQQRGQAIDEAAITGNLRQPNFLAYQLGNQDAGRAKALTDMFSNLESEKSGELLGGIRSGQNAARTGALNKVNLLSGLQGQSRSANLAERGFNADVGLANRKQTFDEIFGNAQLAEQVRGRTDIDEWDKHIGRIGGLVGAGTSLFGKGGSGGLIGRRNSIK